MTNDELADYLEKIADDLEAEGVGSLGVEAIRGAAERVRSRT